MGFCVCDLVYAATLRTQFVVFDSLYLRNFRDNSFWMFMSQLPKDYWHFLSLRFLVVDPLLPIIANYATSTLNQDQFATLLLILVPLSGWLGRWISILLPGSGFCSPFLGSLLTFTGFHYMYRPYRSLENFSSFHCLYYPSKSLSLSFTAIAVIWFTTILNHGGPYHRAPLSFLFT